MDNVILVIEESIEAPVIFIEDSGETPIIFIDDSNDSSVNIIVDDVIESVIFIEELFDSPINIIVDDVIESVIITAEEIIGLPGADGINGTNGIDGSQGIQGVTGSDGATGSQGEIGLTGNDGIQGEIGLTGNDGTDGIDGNDGLNGADGIQGDTGLTGADGLTTSVNGVTQINGAITLTKDDIGLSEVPNLAFSGDNTGDQTLSGLGGVVANAAIVAATKTKITYDTKGLVTAGADATTADVADSSNKRYVTDAQLIVIGNTSNNNTGDNATNTQYSGLAASKEDASNKSTSVTTDQASDTKYPSVKAVYDWAVGLFATIANLALKANIASPTFTTNITTPLIIGGTGTTQELIYKTTSGVGATGARHIWQVGNNGATEAMTILNNGNVGIGTASPAGLLHVSGVTDSSPVRITGNAARLDFYSTNANAGTRNWMIRPDRVVFGDFNILQSNAKDGNPESAGTTRLYIKNDGNVGFGTTSPTAVLHLKAGTATASSSPIKLTAGTNLTTPENGAIEFDGTNIFLTVGGVRKTFTLT